MPAVTQPMLDGAVGRLPAETIGGLQRLASSALGLTVVWGTDTTLTRTRLWLHFCAWFKGTGSFPRKRVPPVSMKTPVTVCLLFVCSCPERILLHEHL